MKYYNDIVDIHSSQHVASHHHRHRVGVKRQAATALTTEGTLARQPVSSQPLLTSFVDAVSEEAVSVLMSEWEKIALDCCEECELWAERARTHSF